jgi:hypothetical protein
MVEGGTEDRAAPKFLEVAMRRDDQIYTAGLVDGEGSVLLTHHHNEHRHPAVTLPSTTYVFMTFLKRTFGGSISTKRPNKPQHSKSWTWAVNNNRALKVLQLLVPFMKDPKKLRRARFILKEYKACTSPNGKYTAQLLAKKKKFERKFFTL